MSAASIVRLPLRGLRDLVSLTKPRITVMVVATMGAGYALAPIAARPSSSAISLALIATALIVGAASAMNSWIERDSDRLMTRTARRPLPAGRLQPRAAVAVATVSLGLGLPTLSWATNGLTASLGAIAFVSYVGIYTPLKRRSWTALLVGAVPGAIPPLMGWTAATGEIGAPGFALFSVLYLWQLPHFAAIAVRREREYAEAGIRAVSVARGRRWTVGFATLTAGGLLPVSLSLALLGVAGAVYVVSMSILGAAFAGCALSGFFTADHDRWARRLFLASLLYLPLMFVALGIDQALT